MATRNGSARWDGDLATGSGTVIVGDGAWTGSYSYASRFEDGAGTNPEELIAAAHAGCFSMALSYTLAEAGHTPHSIETTARVHLRLVDGKPTIQQIDLATEGDISDLAEEDFRKFAEHAKAACAVSRALGGVTQITVSPRLATVTRE
jgi:osmotically inducible protein OsmC